MKRILKTAIALLSAGAIATPLAAAEWGVGGQVRVNWDISKTSENKTKGLKTTESGVSLGGDSTWVVFTLTGESANGGLYYYSDGTRKYTASASAEEGNWSASATFTSGNDSKGENHSESEHTVSVSNANGFSVKIGHTTPLYTFSQGAGNLLQGYDGGDGSSISALDNRSNVVDFNYKLGDSLSVGLALEQSSSSNKNLGKAFDSLSYGSAENNATDDLGAPSSNNGIKVNYTSDLVNVGLVVVNGSEAGNKDLGGDENYKASASAFGLGIGLSFGNLKPYFNLWNPSAKSENATYSDESTTSTTQFGVDLALGESSGVGFSLVSSSISTKTKAGDEESTELKTTGAGTELGYVTKLGTADFKAGFLNTTEKVGDADPATTTSIKVRLQQGF